MNKQEIIDNLRLQVSDRDMALIDLNAKLRNAVDLLKRVDTNDEILLADINEFLK